MEIEYCPSGSSGMNICNLLAMVPCPPPDIGDSFYTHLESRNQTSKVVEYIADYCEVPEQTSTTHYTTPTTTSTIESSTAFTNHQTANEHSTHHTQTTFTSGTTYLTKLSSTESTTGTKISSTESTTGTVPFYGDNVSTSGIQGIAIGLVLFIFVGIALALLAVYYRRQLTVFFKRNRKNKGSELKSLKQRIKDVFTASLTTRIASYSVNRTRDPVRFHNKLFDHGDCVEDTHSTLYYENTVTMSGTTDGEYLAVENFCIPSKEEINNFNPVENCGIFWREKEFITLSTKINSDQSGDARSNSYDEPDSDEEYDKQLQRYSELM
ncbi:hypothetical protein MAR_001038 [Mya arenaria]|uniref:Uncharacterized protein n=1 Tax=Mya arenaria TaxID=6604 RepID=A0ABY7FAS3_MYAAR|nr:uncharacterized protein LOC128207431 [Mya arenaria]WAR19200.1 hypothetical protein MAR_001038 [Mya arenaria]